jgi:hypothetical protein
VFFVGILFTVLCKNAWDEGGNPYSVSVVVVVVVVVIIIIIIILGHLS